MPTDSGRAALSWNDVLRSERLRRIDLAIQDTLIGGTAAPATGPCPQCTPERFCTVHEEDGPLLEPIGRVLGERYRVDSLVGAGGIGAVYRGTDLSNGRHVAIKRLRPQFEAHEELLARFHREARTLSRLRHPNIVAVTDFGKRERDPFMVMELLVGRSLEAELFEGRLPVDRALSLIRQILAALEHAHAHGVVHRDLKPQNVMIVPTPEAPEGVLKVLDFGMAKVAPETRHTGDRTLTQGARVFGTPGYMSPEQAAGKPADERSDLYNAGLVLFELCTGRPPFAARSNEEMMRHQRMTPAPSMRKVAPQADVPWALDCVVARCLAKDPSARFQTAAELAHSLALAERLGRVDPHVRAAAPVVSDLTELASTLRGIPHPLRRGWARTLRNRIENGGHRVLDLIEELVTPGAPKRG